MALPTLAAIPEPAASPHSSATRRAPYKLQRNDHYHPVLSRIRETPDETIRSACVRLEISQHIYLRVIDAVASDHRTLRTLQESHPNNVHRYIDACTRAAGFWDRVLDNQLPVPPEIELHPSAFCPLDCWYCCSPNAYATGALPTRLRNDRIAHYLEELRGQVHTLQISGGREPLFDSSLPSLLESVRTHPLHVRINTSAFTTIDANKIDRLGHLFDHVAISLDAPDSKLYREIKGIQDESVFAQVVESLGNLCRNKPRHTTVELVVLVLPQNLRHLQRLAQLAVDVRANGIRLRRLKTHTLHPRYVSLTIADRQPAPRHAWASVQPHLDRQVVSCVVHILKKRFESQKFYVSMNDEDFALDYDNYVRDNRSPCFSANRRLVIDPHGNVYPCPLTAYPDQAHGVGRADLYHVNIKDHESFGSLWNAIAPSIRRLHETPCQNCYVADRYLNNFVAKLRDDREAGVPIGDQLFARMSAIASKEA